VNSKALVEAALFISDKPLSIQQLSRLTRLKENEVRLILQKLSQELSKEDRGIELVETPKGFELRVKKEYREKVSVLAPLADLSDGMMRTLSLVVLNQPIRQSDIVKFQGNKAYGYIKGLEEKGLIKTQKHGRTKLLTVSSDFERYFGKSVEEIKKALIEKLR
jgi:segregation and condensation protein B